MPTIITRTAMTDDDGSGTTGTVFNNAWKVSFYDQIDAMFAGPVVLGGALTVPGTMTLTSNPASYGVIFDGSNGGGIAATHASGALRLYTNALLRWTVNSSGTLVGASGCAISVAGEAIQSDHTVPFVGANAGSDAGTTAVYNASGRILKLSSSERYKEHIEPWILGNDALATFLALSPESWDYKGKDTGAAGFISERLAVLPITNRYGRSPLVNYDTEGRPDSNRDYAIIGLQHLVIQNLSKRIDALEARQ